MIDTPQRIQTCDQDTAVIRLRIPKAEVRTVMGPAIRELMSTLNTQGVVAAGPWFIHHFQMDPNFFDIEVSVPVLSPVAAAGRVVPGFWPAMTGVRAVHQGSYEGLGKAWQEFADWIAAEGHKTMPDHWECYVVGPESTSDTSAWRTELSRALIV